MGYHPQTLEVCEVFILKRGQRAEDNVLNEVLYELGVAISKEIQATTGMEQDVGVAAAGD